MRYGDSLSAFATARASAAAGVTFAILATSSAASTDATDRTSVRAADGEKPAALFVSSSGSASAPCTRSAPCSSWSRAYQRAKPGDVIEVAGGTYPKQVIESRTSTRNLQPGCTIPTPANCIVFRPAKGQTVMIDGSLEIRGSSVWVRGSVTPAQGIPGRGRSYSIRVRGYADTEADSDTMYPDHVILEGIDATSFGVFNVDTATFKNMDIGPATIGADCRILEGPGIENKVGFGGGVTVMPRNVTLDGLFIHNHNRNEEGAASDCHFGGFFLVTADGLTIRNSVFSQNAVYNIQVQNFGGAPSPRNVRLENNWFGCPVGWLYQPGGENRCIGQVDLQFNAASQFRNWLIRHNSFAGGISQYVDGASYVNVRVVGNAGSYPSQCFTGMTFAYNAWDGRGCSPTDRDVRRLPFVSVRPGLEDFRLAPGTPAAGFVSAESADLQLAVDMEGRMRPVRFPRDAGALQRDTAAMVTGRTIGSAAIGMARGELVRRYGEPRRSRPAKLGQQKTPGRIDTFAVPGGSLLATIVDDRVVGLATASQYYSTVSGLGVGSPFRDAARVSRTTWVKCKKALQRSSGPVVVTFRPGGGRTKVAEITMIRRVYEQQCAAKK